MLSGMLAITLVLAMSGGRPAAPAASPKPALSAAPAAAAAEPKPGDVAPDFSLAGADGKTFTLSDYRGKKNVVVVFFPKAFTGG